MSFIASGAAPAEDTLSNTAFWPELSVDAFRTSMRVDSVTTPERARHALSIALVEANRRLSPWQQTQQAAGYETLADVPPRPELPEGSLERLYLSAVWCLAKATLIERYRDYDTTHQGQTNDADAPDIAADYRRDASWAISDLTGERRTTVELI